MDDLIDALRGTDIVGALAAIADEQTIGALSKILVGVVAEKKSIGNVEPGQEKSAGDGVGHCVRACIVRDLEIKIGAHQLEQYLPAAIKDGSFDIVPEPKWLAEVRILFTKPSRHGRSAELPIITPPITAKRNAGLDSSLLWRKSVWPS